MTPEMVERVMGLKEGSLGVVAWVALRAEAEGVGREEVAAGLGCGSEDIAALVWGVAQGTAEGAVGSQEAAEAVWMQGIVALRTSAMLNNQGINSGWDSLEAMALKHLNASLAKVKNGDPDKMLRIASMANAAKRRARGEGMGGGTRIGIAAGGNGVTVAVGTTLRSGDVGVMRLNLSPAIRDQMGDTARVIEGKASRPESGVPEAPNGPSGPSGLKRLEMLRIGDVRELIDGPNESGKEKNAISQAVVKDIMGDYFSELGENGGE